MPAPNRMRLIGKLEEALNNFIMPEYIEKMCQSVQKQMRAIMKVGSRHLPNLLKGWSDKEMD